MLFSGEASRQIGPEFFQQQRDTVTAPARMAERIFDFNSRRLAAILEGDTDRRAIRAPLWVEQARGKLLVHGHVHLCAQAVDTRVGGGGIFVIRGG